MYNNSSRYGMPVNMHMQSMFCSGNWNGVAPYKVGAPCTECNSGSFYCTYNLCDGKFT